MKLARFQSTLTLRNSVVTVAKFGAWLGTGSGSMFSEGLHSLADVCNQCLLAFGKCLARCTCVPCSRAMLTMRDCTVVNRLPAGISRSLRVPDRDHPYGYGPERYVWSLISGVGIFFIGCGVSLYHGIHSLIDPTPIHSMPLALGMCVLHSKSTQLPQPHHPCRHTTSRSTN
jgi:solute carrier family 30 (zinc transporter), member 9